MRVLDTAALLHWPLSKLNGKVVHSQRDELIRISPDREIILDAAELDWMTPSPENIQQATKLAKSTGDLAGLSNTDLELLALTIQLDAILVTDDYRLQNCCAASSLVYETVMTTGISEKWSWYLVCTGCGGINQNGDVSSKQNNHGTCANCGSKYKMRKNTNE